MPGWGGDNMAQLLYENRSALLFAGEVVPAGTASIAVQLRRSPGLAYPWGCSFEVTFPSDPGSFGVDIEVADSDLDSSYTTATSITEAGGGGISNLWARFVRARVTTPSSVPMTLMVTR